MGAIKRGETAGIGKFGDNEVKDGVLRRKWRSSEQGWELTQ